MDQQQKFEDLKIRSIQDLEFMRKKIDQGMCEASAKVSEIQESITNLETIKKHVSILTERGGIDGVLADSIVTKLDRELEKCKKSEKVLTDRYDIAKNQYMIVDHCINKIKILKTMRSLSSTVEKALWKLNKESEKM